jgi:hypothetical protein
VLATINNATAIVIVIFNTLFIFMPFSGAIARPHLALRTLPPDPSLKVES